MTDAGLSVDDQQVGNIISYVQVRNAQIRSEYAARVKAGSKREAVKMELADEYCLSCGTINKIVFSQR